jgi:hypothetical protein
MMSSRAICHMLVALSMATAAGAQETHPLEEQDAGQPVIISEPPAAEPPGAVEEPPYAEVLQDTAVIDTPPASSDAAPGGRVPAEQIRPKGEDEMVGDHPVDAAGIKFRPGKGVEINSADDDFQLRIRVRVQLLYSLVRGNLGPREADEPEELRNDVAIRRARFILQGHAFGKDNQYKLEIDPLWPDNVVLDYYLDFTQNKNVEVRVGQYKISSNRQRVISSGDLQMVDRSSVNAEFSLDRDIGLDIPSRDFLGKNRMR